MATKPKMKNPQPETKKLYGDFTIGSHDYQDYYGQVDRAHLAYKGKLIFQYDNAGNMNCCGMFEVSGWYFTSPKGMAYCEDMQKAFNDLILNEIHDDDGGTGSILLFNVTRNSKTQEIVQPEWFIKCLENAPNSYELDWMHNTNTQSTDIKMFVIKANA